MRARTEQRLFRRAVGAVAVEAAHVAAHHLLVGGLRRGGIVTARAETVGRGGEQPLPRAAVRFMAGPAIAFPERFVDERRLRFRARGFVALEARRLRAAIPDQVLLVGRVRVVAADALPLRKRLVLAGRRRGVLHPRVAVITEIGKRFREYQPLHEAVALVARRAVVLRDRVVHELLLVFGLRFLVAVVAGLAPGAGGSLPARSTRLGENPGVRRKECDEREPGDGQP